jgi:hypothetical protein
LAGEIHLPLIVERLAAEHQHRMPVDGLPQRRDGGRIKRTSDIDAAHLADKKRVQLAHGKAHFEVRPAGASG